MYAFLSNYGNTVSTSFNGNMIFNENFQHTCEDLKMYGNERRTLCWIMIINDEMKEEKNIE